MFCIRLTPVFMTLRLKVTHLVIPGEAVDLHLRAARAEGEVVIRLTFTFLPVHTGGRSPATRGHTLRHFTLRHFALRHFALT